MAVAEKGLKVGSSLVGSGGVVCSVLLFTSPASVARFVLSFGAFLSVLIDSSPSASTLD